MSGIERPQPRTQERMEQDGVDSRAAASGARTALSTEASSAQGTDTSQRVYASPQSEILARQTAAPPEAQMVPVIRKVLPPLMAKGKERVLVLTPRTITQSMVILEDYLLGK